MDRWPLARAQGNRRCAPRPLPLAGQTRQALENVKAVRGEVHGVPRGHQGLRGDERCVRDVFPDGSTRALDGGRERARAGRAGGDRVSGGGGVGALERQNGCSIT